MLRVEFMCLSSKGILNDLMWFRSKGKYKENHTWKRDSKKT